MSQFLVHGIREPVPGPRWTRLFEATWPAYRAWYLREGERARPTLGTAQAALERHMPELMATWERMVKLAGGDATAARMLTLYDPPRFLPGCSQAVLTGPTPILVRNYDYHPDLWERVVYSTAFTGRRVIGTSDCLWGLLDGMNDAGLVISLAFGGRKGAGSGFGIPLVVRYLLETADTVERAVDTLTGLPVNMAYNLTLLDRHAEAATVFVAPGAEPQRFDLRAATNHRATVPEDLAHARSFRSVERQQVLLALLDRQPDPTALIAAFLQAPLHNTAYDRGFGTLYTAAYRPKDAAVDYIWPGSTWRRGFDSPDSTRTVILPAPSDTHIDPDKTPPRAQPDAADARTGDQDTMCSREDLTHVTPDELAVLAETTIAELAARADPAAFAHLLQLTRIVGESVGASARTMAGQSSWAGVGDIARVSRQSAWERWRTP